MKVRFAVTKKGECFEDSEKIFKAEIDVLPLVGTFVQHPAEKQLYQVSTTMFVLRTENAIMGHADVEAVVFLEKFSKLP